MKRFLWLLALIALLAAACGGGDSDATDTSEVDEELSATDASAPSGASTASADPGSDPNSSWCVGAAAVQARVDEIEARGLPLQEQLRAQFEELLEDQIALLNSAPSDLEADARAWADGLSEAAALFASVDYNFFALDEEQSAIIDDPAVQAASEAVEDYLENVCLIDIDGQPDTNSPTDLRLTDDEIDALLSGDERDEVIGSLVALGIGETEAECVMREALRAGVNVLGQIDAELIAILTDCGVSAEQLAAIGLGTTEEDVSTQLESIAALFTPELQAALQSSSAARDGLAAIFVQQGLDQGQADCAVQTLADLEDLSALEDLDQLLELMLECGISLNDLANIG